MLEKTLAAVIGLVAFATMTAVAIVAAAFALYAVLAPSVGQAGAAALVAGVIAIIIAVVVVIVANKSNHHHRDQDHGGADFGFVPRLIEMAKEKPLLSAGAAIAAAVIAFRNPALVATIVAAFVDKPKKG